MRCVTLRPTKVLGHAAWAGALAASVQATPAFAQNRGLTTTLEVSSDERRRGISWSDGDPVLRGTVSMPVADGLSLDASATTLWGSARHGGADAVLDVGGSYVRQIGGWRLTGDARYHLFPGARDQGYGEVGVITGFLIGPANLDLAARYAPRQSAIGGDNLYLSAAATIAIPATPFTLSAHLGRSSGKIRDPMAAQRLRPDGRYWDHGVALDWYRGRWSAGLHYTGNSIDDRIGVDTGDRLIARLGLTL